MPQNQPSPPAPNAHISGIRKYGEIATKTPQVDWTITDNGKGLLSGTLKYFYEVSTGNALDQTYMNTLPQQGDVHPYDVRLFCKDCTLTVGANDIGYCDANYIGVNLGNGGVADIECKLSCPTEEDPIQVHPSFSLKSDKEGSFGIVTEEGKAPTYQPTYDREMVVLGGKNLTEFDKFKISPKTIEKDLVGVTSYKVARPTLSVSFVTVDEEQVKKIVASVGKQTASPDNAPSWATNFEGRTWLLTSASISELLSPQNGQGKIYRVETEYMLSGMGSDGKGKPWNKLIYKDI